MMNTADISEALSAAIWVTASPHEWTWTKEQQVAMARYCIHASSVIHKAVSDLEKIVCTKDPDDGVILLSSESPAHYDAATKCETYNHEHFSPLGDALIALHKHLSEPQP